MKSIPPARILIVDDEESMCEMLSVVLEKQGHKVAAETDPRQGLQRLQQDGFDLVIQDLKMPELDGIELLAEIKKLRPEMLVIIMTAYSTWDRAVEAMRLGAFDYLKKPFDNDLVRSTVAKALEQKRVYENYLVHGGQFEPVAMIGSSEKIKKVAAIIRRIAKTDSTVLIDGESGTGKEIAARSLHSSSLRAHQPFIALNCGAFTESLLESEIFGHVRGSFTGAVADKMGLLELAHGGTLFLDEIGEMTLATQVKFLKVLEDRKFFSVGGTKPVQVDVRFIAATHRDLEVEVKMGAFREDLFYRLNVIPLHLPALRERREDIPLLAGHFLAEYAVKINPKVKRFSNQAMEDLMAARWSGNIRELENVIHRAVVFCEGDVIEAIDVHKSATEVIPIQDGTKRIPEEGIDLEEKIEEMEKAYLIKALAQSDYHLTNAAKLLNMTFRSFRYKIKKYGIDTSYYVK